MSAGGTVDTIDKFTDSIKLIVDRAWEPGWGTFSNEWPTQNDPNSIDLPQITYRLFHRIPSKSMRTIKPKQFGYVEDPDVPGGVIWQYSMWFDCLVDFGIWAKTNREAEDLKVRFEDMMHMYAGHFKFEGISELLFELEHQPEVSAKWRQDIPHRALRYFVRIERIYLVRSDTLQKVTAEIDVNGQEAITTSIPNDETSEFLTLLESAKPGFSPN